MKYITFERNCDTGSQKNMRKSARAKSLFFKELYLSSAGSAQTGNTVIRHLWHSKSMFT